ncbi:hypothetical protein C8R44DRAFT_749645 [Mycena epipterygia]|nr:hypothetical protein C8R44DRAFT_749645 [Mycena epipterygia]
MAARMAKRKTRVSEEERVERRRQIKAASYARHPEEREKSRVRMAEKRAAAKLKKRTKKAVPSGLLQALDMVEQGMVQRITLESSPSASGSMNNPARGPQRNISDVALPAKKTASTERGNLSAVEHPPRCASRTSAERVAVLALAGMAGSGGNCSVLEKGRLLSCDDSDRCANGALYYCLGLTIDRRAAVALDDTDGEVPERGYHPLPAPCSTLSPQQLIDVTETGGIRPLTPLTRVQKEQLVVALLNMAPLPRPTRAASRLWTEVSRREAPPWLPMSWEGFTKVLDWLGMEPPLDDAWDAATAAEFAQLELKRRVKLGIRFGKALLMLGRTDWRRLKLG